MKLFALTQGLDATNGHEVWTLLYLRPFTPDGTGAMEVFIVGAPHVHIAASHAVHIIRLTIKYDGTWDDIPRVLPPLI